MTLLSDSDLSSVHAAAISAGLIRAALMAAISPFLVASIGTAETSDQQLLADLHALNSAGKLTDGTVPLESWLMNAQLLSDPGRGEADVFRRCVEMCRLNAARVDPKPLRSTWSIAPSPALAALNQMAHAAPWLVDEHHIIGFLDAITRLGLVSVDYREALLAGIPSAILDEIPYGSTPISQIALDVAMVSGERLGGLPIVRWLANACVLAEPRVERDALFSEMIGLVARVGIRDLVVDLHPPLATDAEDLIRLAATYSWPPYEQALFSQINMDSFASPPRSGSPAAIALVNFYHLYTAPLGKDGAPPPFLQWLDNLRVVTDVTSTYPIATEVLQLKMRYVRHLIRQS